MAVYETYSKRLALANVSDNDVYQYDVLPRPLRVQIAHIFGDSIGVYRRASGYMDESSPANRHWEFIHDTLARERGEFELGKNSRANDRDVCIEYLLNSDTNGALDIIELGFRYIDRILHKLSQHERQKHGITQTADDAIEELNHRFVEHRVGFQFSDGSIIRVDSQFIHAEIVKPALKVLTGPIFQGASDEFLKAHEHYRSGRGKEAINEAAKAFESVMKAICDHKGWTYQKSDGAQRLIGILIEKKYIPEAMASQFTSLRALLESGLPTIRNSTPTTHGQGTTLQAVSDDLAAYAMHMSAANILFLARLL